MAWIVLLACFSLLIPAASLADICDGVGAACTLEDLGNNRYRFTWDVTNGSPMSNAIFKWGVDTPNIPSAWVTVGFDVPTGWVGSHPDSHIDFDAANGSGSPDRIFSSSVVDCGAGPTLTFRWTFDNNGGPTPDCDELEFAEYRFHLQPIDGETCANDGLTIVCAGIVPVEPATWGSIKSIYRQ